MADARARVRGQLDLVQDLVVPGMLHGAIARSTVPHGRIVSFDASAARAVPGVVSVVTGADLLAHPEIQPIYGPQIKDQPIVAFERVRHVGDVVALVAAETRQAAEEAAALVDVRYEELPSVFDPVQAMAPDAPLVHQSRSADEGSALYFDLRPDPGTNCCNHFRLRQGDVAAGFAAADLIVEETFRTPAIQHVAMEPHAVLASWEEDRLIVRSGTQTPFNLRRSLAETFGLPDERVRVITGTLGGSYGAKVFPRIEPQAALLARLTGRPVRIVLRRDEEFVTLNRHATTITIRLGLRQDGTTLAKEVVAHWDTGAYADCGPNVAQKGGFGVVGPYNIPNVAVDSLCVYTNLPPAGAFRGYAVTQAAWASECAMDVAAERLRIDPFELRRRNLLRSGDRFATGEHLEDVHFEECLERAAAAIGWKGPARVELPDGRVRAKGLSVIMKGMTTPSRSEARIAVDAAGQVTVYSSTVEMGQGAHTVLAQLAAAELRLPYESVAVVGADTDVTPFDNRTTSSRSTYMMGNAVKLAAASLRRRLLELAAEQLESAVADLELREGIIQVVGVPDRAVSFGKLADGAGPDGLSERAEFRNEGGLDPETGQGVASSHWHQGAGAVEVEVDHETGVVSILRAYTAVYAGQIVNRHLAALQTLGNVVFGIGSARFEEIVYDGGQVVNPNLSDYLIPSFLDLPGQTGFELLERPGADMHGLGETALPTIPAAVGNAVARATGARVRELPLSPERVLQAMDEAGMNLRDGS